MNDANATTWIAVAISIITTIGGAATGYLAYRGNRDKLSFDATLIKMQAANEECERRYQSLAKQFDDEMKDCQERAAKMEKRLENLEAFLMKGNL